MNEVLKVIKERRTTRKFKPEQIKDEELQAILEAGLYAPSCHNEQSWHFTVIQNSKVLNELNIETKYTAKNIEDETVQKLANNEKFNIFYSAPTVVVVSGKNDSLMPQVDCAAATQNMFIAAESLNVGGCWNGFIAMLFDGPKGEEYKKKLNIPEDHTPYYAVALGYTETRATKAYARKENNVQYIK